MENEAKGMKTVKRECLAKPSHVVGEARGRRAPRRGAL